VVVTKQSHSTDRRWSCSALVCLLIALTTWTSAWSLNSLGAEMNVAVHEGKLSVDLRGAQIREVLEIIGQQTGLRVYIDAAANGMVNAQFTGMALDQGLRRLLRAASLSYTLLYTQGPAEVISLQEVRVFGEARGETSPGNDRAGRQRGQRTAALATPRSQEENAEPAPPEPVEDVEPEPEEPEQDAEAAQN
jgi:type II secretory pathway component GspD/PulD (secretin)